KKINWEKGRQFKEITGKKSKSSKHSASSKAQGSKAPQAAKQAAKHPKPAKRHLADQQGQPSPKRPKIQQVQRSVPVATIVQVPVATGRPTTTKNVHHHHGPQSVQHSLNISGDKNPVVYAPGGHHNTLSYQQHGQDEQPKPRPKGQERQDKDKDSNSEGAKDTQDSSSTDKPTPEAEETWTSPKSIKQEDDAQKPDSRSGISCL
ncbi:uncharacterized protein LOC119720723, partial [Patiria miniata]|uniref:Uncharacterized protein n=1 Tax=Patiria miniata TaxID=46514 RepID=A0A913Z428_PATMI